MGSVLLVGTGGALGAMGCRYGLSLLPWRGVPAADPGLTNLPGAVFIGFIARTTGHGRFEPVRRPLGKKPACAAASLPFPPFPWRA